MPTIPNELIITINTSIPGYQKIKYTPSMTIKNISSDDKTVRFNPLTKLSKSVIDKIPEDLRKKEFFNRGLFDSLLNYTNHTVKTLDQATREGIVDNNIKVTLNTLFPNDSIIYIGDKPYSISDFQWSTGDWKIDTKKKKEELDKSKITNPYLYKTVIQDNIISGQKQLNSIPLAMIYGANYDGPKLSNTASGRGIQPTITNPSIPITNPPIPITNPPIPITNPQPITNPPIPITNPQPTITTKPLPKGPSNVIEPVNKLVPNIVATDMIKQIFSGNFYHLVNKISNESINKAIYIESVNGLSIIQNNGGGDCFFIAVADAINYYNFANQQNRIISGRYGTGVNLYTPLYLRTLVYEFLQTWSELNTYFENTAPVNVDNMNDIFEQTKNGLHGRPISPEDYVELAHRVYISNDNFLVDNVNAVPINIANYDRPFNIIEKSKLQNYILSNNYWANEIAVYALCAKIKVNIIPISIQGITISIPFVNFNEDNGWDKYLFLYYSNSSHFELITFTNQTNLPKINTNRITIFNRSENPPIYMLLTIFGANYSTINDPITKFNFTFKKEIMENIENNINVKLYDTLKGNYATEFYNLFKSYFPNSKIKPPKPIKPIKPPRIIGGNQYQQQYRNPYIESKMMKEENIDSSQLAYYITIYMELYPGTSIPPEEKANLKCKSKWNSVRKAYADFLGKQYIIPPVYTSKTLNNTRKNIPNKLAVGGKKNKTKKHVNV